MSEAKTYDRGLSLCMIVKNEEASIERCIRSVADIVDEIIVVDTGSHDTTVEKALALGAQIHFFTWQDDFSAARNVSIAQAHYSWILVLDADEMIARRDLKAVRAVINSYNCMAAVMYQRTYCNDPEAEGFCANTTDYPQAAHYAGYYDIPVIRLFRNSPTIYYEGVIHEIVDSTVGLRKKKYLDVPIHHFTRFTNAALQAHKDAHYERLLLKDFEARPCNSRTCFLLGRHFQAKEQFAEAAVFLKRAIDLGELSEMAYENLGSVYLRTHMFEEARDVLEKIIARNPRYVDALLTLAVVYYEMHMKDEAIALLEKSITLRPHSVKPFFNLGVMHYREKDYARAEQALKKAAALSPNIPRIYYVLFFVYYEQQKYAEALHCSQTLLRLDTALYQNIQSRVDHIHMRHMHNSGA